MPIKVIRVSKYLIEEIENNFGLRILKDDIPASECETISLYDGDNEFQVQIKVYIPKSERVYVNGVEDKGYRCNYLMDVKDYFAVYIGSTSVKWQGSFL